jgi:hypothetical protein
MVIKYWRLERAGHVARKGEKKITDDRRFETP